MRRCIGIVCILAMTLLMAGCAVQAQQLTIPNPELAPPPTPAPVAGIMDVLSENIHINQLGYRPQDNKTVKVPGEYPFFYVMDCGTGQVVYEGAFGETKPDWGADEDVSRGDFSAVSAPGRYVVQVPELGHSYEFDIGEDVYAGLNRAVLKMLYYQRCGVDLTETYAGRWAHGACHTEKGELYGEKGAIDGSGGWHTAGDYGKYTVPAARTAADLFLAYALYPEAFGDDTGIPESGNGIPDILDEARVGVEWLLKMQDPDSGGVHHKYTPEALPMMEIMPQSSVACFSAAGISPTATGGFCAVMAQAARVYADIDNNLAARCLDAAKTAYGWIRANPEAQPYQNPDGIITPEYRDTHHRDEYFWASMELYVTTGEQAYLDDADPYGDQAVLFWSNTLDLYDVSLLGVFSYLLSDRAEGDSVLYRGMSRNVIQMADEITGWASKNGYGIHMAPRDYEYGSNLIVSSRAVVLLFADRLAPDEAYVQTARAHYDYLLGCNTLNQCYVTGFGAKTVLHPHHRPSVADGVEAPVPGMVPGGPNADREDPVAQDKLGLQIPPAKCYLDETGAYSLNEVATYWNTPMVLLCAYFNGQDQ